MLLINKTTNEENGISYGISSKNEGVLDAEVILLVEGWVNEVKKNFNERVFRK